MNQPQDWNAVRESFRNLNKTLDELQRLFAHKDPAEELLSQIFSGLKGKAK